MESFILYLKMGFFHVLDWQATDHLLFLTVLVAASTLKEWKHLLSLVTAFTIGHTTSLILSVMGWVTVSGAWIEFLIPVTIIFTGMVNIIKGNKANKKEKIGLLWALLFGFIHGFGFSNYLKNMLFDAEDKWIPMFEFALGIELAQIVIVLTITFLYSLLNFSVKMAREIGFLSFQLL